MHRRPPAPVRDDHRLIVGAEGLVKMAERIPVACTGAEQTGAWRAERRDPGRTGSARVGEKASG